jgi:TRAP-type C4-dicarboxylate transport system permease small subunit
MPTALGRAHDALTAVGFLAAKLCLVVIVVSYTYEIVARYFFLAPTSWSNEAVSYALCIGTFLAMPELTRRRGHIAISFVIESLSERAARALAIAIAVVSGLVCLFVAGLSFEENIRQVVHEVMLVRVDPIPKVWISSWITFGFLSSGLHFLRAAFDPQLAPAAADTSIARA